MDAINSTVQTPISILTKARVYLERRHAVAIDNSPYPYSLHLDSGMLMLLIEQCIHVRLLKYPGSLGEKKIATASSLFSFGVSACDLRLLDILISILC